MSQNHPLVDLLESIFGTQQHTLDLDLSNSYDILANSGIDISSLSSEQVEQLADILHSHNSIENLTSHHNSNISFAGNSDYNYYIKQAENSEYYGNSYLKDAHNATSWAETYLKEGKIDKANSYMQEAKYYESKANSFFKEAKDYRAKADSSK